MNLYKVNINDNSNSHRLTFFVISENEKEASDLAIKTYNKYGYYSFVYVKNIGLIASEGQYGKPDILLIAKEQGK